MTYYVMFEGRVRGVYEEWEDYKKQVHRFSSNCYKGYATRHEAVAKWKKHQSNNSKMKIFVVLSLLLTIVAVVPYFILV
jgi:viroplasmin and RNaseH domain-containing protein